MCFFFFAQYICFPHLRSSDNVTPMDLAAGTLSSSVLWRKCLEGMGVLNMEGLTFCGIKIYSYPSPLPIVQA